MPVAKNCEICGDEYFVKPSVADKRHTCGRSECKSKWCSINRKGEKHPNWNGGQVSKNCEICGDEYFVYSCSVERRHTCGKSECVSKWQSKVQSGENNGNWKGGEISKICEICGDEYFVIPSDLNKRHTCGRPECKAKYLSMFHQGITDPEEWQGFAKEKPYCEKWTPDTERRTRLFFGNKSVLSGKTREENGGRRLTCHHVYHDKEACCKDESCDVENYFIIDGERHLINGRTDKFILLTCGENTKVEHDKLKWVRYFENLINTRFGGISYYTKKEYKWIMEDPYYNEFSHITGTYFPPGFDHGRGDDFITGMVDYNEYMNEYHKIQSPYKKMVALMS